MSSIMGQIEPEHPELFALEFVKVAESDFVDQLVPNMITIYMTMRPWMSSIMGQIGQ